MQAQTLSAISIKWPRRGLFLIQTKHQLFMTIALTSVTTVVIQAIPALSDGARTGALIGQFSAVITWLILVLPASFEWRLTSINARANACQQVLRWFTDLGYTKQVSSGKYSLDGPRWLLGDTNRLSIDAVDCTVKVSGPWIVIRRLRRLAEASARK